MAFSSAALIKETTTTTGTGDITLAGAASGYFSFSSKMTPGAYCYVPYVIRSSTQYEIGLGRLSAASVLQRVAVYESSNANALVAFDAGTKDVYCGAGGKYPEGIKHNFAGAGSPLDATHNKTQGYAATSIWVDEWSEDLWMGHYYAAESNALSWMLIASRNWQPVSRADGQRTYAWALNSPLLVLPADMPTSTNALFVQAQNAELRKQSSNHLYGGSALYGPYSMSMWPQTDVHGGNHTGQSDAGVHQVIRQLYAARTTNATQTQARINASSFSNLRIPTNAVMRVKVVGVAKQVGSAEYKIATYEATLINNAGTVSAVGSPTWTVDSVSAGASAWIFENFMSADYASFYVTGEAGKTINWTLSLEATMVVDSAA